MRLCVCLEENEKDEGSAHGLHMQANASNTIAIDAFEQKREGVKRGGREKGREHKKRNGRDTARKREGERRRISHTSQTSLSLTHSLAAQSDYPLRLPLSLTLYNARTRGGRHCQGPRKNGCFAKCLFRNNNANDDSAKMTRWLSGSQHERVI